MRLIMRLAPDVPSFNLALEEYCFRVLPPGGTGLIFYCNAPSVIIGRNQNPLAEVAPRYLRGRAIPVVRRMSGGGAVYHDSGNLNFSLLQACATHAAPPLRTLLAPVVAALRALGLPARRNRHNDIVVSDRKVSGSAQYRTTTGVLTHGTLLVCTDLADLHRALASEADALGGSKARASRPSPVANLNEWRSDLTTQAMATHLRDAFAAVYGAPTRQPLETADIEAVQRLAACNYQSWEWNWGRTPAFDFRRSRILAGCRVGCVLTYRHGRIVQVAFEAPPRLKARLQRAAEALLLGRRLGARRTDAAGERGAPGPVPAALAQWLTDLLPEMPPLAAGRRPASSGAVAGKAVGSIRAEFS